MGMSGEWVIVKLLEEYSFRNAFFASNDDDLLPLPGFGGGVRRARTENIPQSTASGWNPRDRSESPTGAGSIGGGVDSENTRENIIEHERRRQEIMNLLGIMLGDGNPLGGAGNGPRRSIPNPLFRLFGGIGDPRDYAFGQSGIDDIMTQLMEQTNQANAPPHLTESEIARLPRTTVKGSDLGEHSECPVCQDEFTNEGDGEVVVHLSCNHHFHPACIESWLKLNATCPVCRKEVVRGGAPSCGVGNE
ncbi:UNVERIFIED_CONTAM: hypothetical protein HDU68_001023 [Siphonaria sp. JEL0065]|nr:hypothetical protein HDU68_001023 [Siphonaria sp. JEL0065]